jgi:hypothetical protein
VEIVDEARPGVVIEHRPTDRPTGGTIMKLLLWLILLVISWPLALLVLILYPIIWLILLPFRLIGITVEAVLSLLKAILMLPARVLRGPHG